MLLLLMNAYCLFCRIVTRPFFLSFFFLFARTTRYTLTSSSVYSQSIHTLQGRWRSPNGQMDQVVFPISLHKEFCCIIAWNSTLLNRSDA